MLIGADGKYTAMEIKDEAETCYSLKDGGWASTAKNSNIRKAIEKAIGSCLSDKAKEEIFISFQGNMKDENLNTCSKAKQVLLDTLLIVSSSLNCSQNTVKLDCSEDEREAVNQGNSSERTVRVDSDGKEVSNEHKHVMKRRKTSSQQSTTSKAQSSGVPHDMKEVQAEPYLTSVNATCKEMQQFTQTQGFLQTKAASKDVTQAETMIVQQTEVKNDSPKGQNLDNLHKLTSNPHLKKEEVDLQANHQKRGKDDSERAQTEKSTSLSYLVLASNIANILDGKKEEDINSKEEHKQQSPHHFAGFQGNVISKEETIKPIVVYQRKEEAGNNKTKELNFDMNIPATSSINDTMQPLNDEGMHPLDIARKKYFFLDDSTPSCRLTEDIDDCGNLIAEPELFRPLGMNTEDYNAKMDNVKKSMSTAIAKQAREPSNKNEESTQGDFSIQCAQRNPTSGEPCNFKYFLKGLEGEDDIIDLTSPNQGRATTWDKPKTCYKPNKMTNSNFIGTSSQQHNKGFSTNLIVGKRLFQDEIIEQQELEGSKHQPITIQDKQLSPEVKILGERAFIDSCYNMAKDTDVLYNTNLTLGSSSSSRSKENLPPKRIIQQSRFHCSPYGNYDRGPLMNYERQLHANILVLSKVEPHRSTWAVLIDNTKVSLGQLGDSFSDDGWVEAYVINVYCRILFRDTHPRQSKKHCFFTTLSDFFLEKWRNDRARKVMRNRALARFEGAGKALPLHECDRLLFPSVHDSHWFLFVVDFATRKFIFLDSLYGASSVYHTEIKDMMIQNFINTWQDCKLRSMGFKNFGIAYQSKLEATLVRFSF